MNNEAPSPQPSPLGRGSLDLRTAITRRVEAHPERVALRWERRAFTYGELLTLVNRTANGLNEAGVGPGSHVALMLPNGPDFVACWLALAWLGATMVPLNTGLRGDLLRFQLEHAETDAVIVGARQLDALQSVRGPRARLMILAADSGAAPEGWLILQDLIEAAPGSSPPERCLPGDTPSLIMYTSGTTGRPKGVEIGPQAQVKHGSNYTGLLRIGPHEAAYVYLPLFHVTAMGTTLGSLLAGATVALDDGFSPFGFWERGRRFRAVVFPFVGSVLSMLYHRPPGPNDADNPVRRAVGAATPAWLWRDFEQRFGLEIIETYGQTEMVALWFMLPRGLGGNLQPLTPRVGTVGMPPEGRFDAKIVDEAGAELPSGNRGEIAIKPRDPADMMVGYYRDPEATASVMRDGWYYTGDLGVRDADGYYAYAGRLKDCIRRRGEMIASFEIERVVNAHPLVMESAAVGVPSELGEEEVKLCVVPLPGSELKPRQIWDYCRMELPRFMVPRWVQVRESLPKTATERVRKPDLASEGVAGCWSPYSGDG